MSSDIIAVCAILFVMVGAAFLLIGRKKSNEVVIYDDDGETKISEYRQQMVEKYVTLIVYWLNTMLMDNKPTVYQSDDLSTTYIDFGTQYGLIHISLFWAVNKARLHFSLHDWPSGSCGDIVVNTVLDKDYGFVRFCKKVMKMHTTMIDHEQDALSAITEIANRSTTSDSTSASDEAIAIYLLATQALGQQKKHNTYSVAAYIGLAAFIQHHYSEELKEILEQYKTETKSD